MLYTISLRVPKTFVQYCILIYCDVISHIFYTLLDNTKNIIFFLNDSVTVNGNESNESALRHFPFERPLGSYFTDGMLKVTSQKQGYDKKCCCFKPH